MIVRIRFGGGKRVGVKPRKQRRLAAGLAGLLTPAAVLAAAVAAWGIAAELNLTGRFDIYTGLFSPGEVWVGAAVARQLGAQLLNRYAKRGETAAS